MRYGSDDDDGALVGTKQSSQKQQCVGYEPCGRRSPTAVAAVDSFETPNIAAVASDVRWMA